MAAHLAIRNRSVSARDQLPPGTFLRSLFDAALAAADPQLALAEHIPAAVTGRTVVTGAGKAAAAMAQAFAARWPGPLEGLVLTRYGHALPCERIEICEGGHPVPDAAGERAARRMIELAHQLGPDDQLVFLASGGGSALLTLPAPGLSLADKQAVTRALLRSGASIGEINTVRKHLSAIKGGRLAAAAAPAQIVTLAISDVPGDDPAVIASGPTVPDPTTFADARAVVSRFRLNVSPQVAARLEQDQDETPKPGQLLADFRLIATPAMALRAAARAAKRAGLAPMILGDALEGESREVGVALAGIARSVRAHGEPLKPPAVLLSGGETTVTMPRRGPSGHGGRNTEFLLGLALALAGAPGIWAAAGDTDGIDGTEDAAGAIVTPDTLVRARAAGLDPVALLDGHDSYR